MPFWLGETIQEDAEFHFHPMVIHMFLPINFVFFVAISTDSSVHVSVRTHAILQMSRLKSPCHGNQQDKTKLHHKISMPRKSTSNSVSNVPEHVTGNFVEGGRWVAPPHWHEVCCPPCFRHQLRPPPGFVSLHDKERFNLNHLLRVRSITQAKKALCFGTAAARTVLERRK